MDSVDFDALEEQARAKMAPASFAFCAAGADDEISAVENITAWRNMRLRPRVLNDVSNIDTRVSLLGHEVATPIMVAPTGRHKLFHAEGERATARGASTARAAYVMASNSNVLIEDVAMERRTAPQWFQLYYWPDRVEVETLIERVAAAGFTALVLTVDAPTGGWSPRAARDQHEASPDILNINMPGSPMARTFYHPDFAGKVLYPATWSVLEWLVKVSPLPVIMKGVLRADDALRCIESGARAIVVSNHGGRHLDTTVTTAAAIGEIASALAGKADVYVDGGIRRGTDILKALALGARAVMIGRPVIWGLTLKGADGVAEVLEHLYVELVRAMQLAGMSKLDDLTPDLVVSKTLSE
ncbi:MAG TPA: alpha-hydroxy acid oxidase [Xanthobacteraceae bacterium]|nr:alpha-hydroxy acid oxidase [Xanthobacteraceae bacterium]